MKLMDFRQPGSLEEARAVMQELGDKALPLAGGTSLVFAQGKEERVAVDLMRTGLQGVSVEGGGFRVFAATRLCDLQSYDAEGWVLDRVAVHLASQQIRNMTTLGGNIARVFPWADFPVALLALNASMTIVGDQERVLTADEYFASQPSRLFKDGSLLRSIEVPAVGRGAGFGYCKQTQTAMGFSLMTAAAVIEGDDDAVRTARVAIGAGVPFPTRTVAVEQGVTGKKGRESMFRKAAEEGLGDQKFKAGDGMSAEYIAHLAAVTVGDALCAAWDEAKGGAS